MLVTCRICSRSVPRLSASMCVYPVSHVAPLGKPCRTGGSWGRRRMDECRVWQEGNLLSLELE